MPTELAAHRWGERLAGPRIPFRLRRIKLRTTVAKPRRRPLEIPRLLLAAAALATAALVLVGVLAGGSKRSAGPSPASAPALRAGSGFSGTALPGDVRAPDFTLT